LGRPVGTQRPDDELAHRRIVERPLPLDREDLAVEPEAGRPAHREVEVRPAGPDHLGQQLIERTAGDRGVQTADGPSDRGGNRGADSYRSRKLDAEPLGQRRVGGVRHSQGERVTVEGDRDRAGASGGVGRQVAGQGVGRWVGVEVEEREAQPLGRHRHDLGLGDQAGAEEHRRHPGRLGVGFALGPRPLLGSNDAGTDEPFPDRTGDCHSGGIGPGGRPP
jgi:hypothetical protein